jgi:hypothetical protein
LWYSREVRDTNNFKKRRKRERMIERNIERERKKMYFDKRSPLINYIVEATIVYSIAVVLVAVAVEKDQTNNHH